MSSAMLHESIKKLLRDNSFLTQADIASKLKMDKVRLSGFLEAMAEYGDVSVKKVGNSKVYFLAEKRK